MLVQASLYWTCSETTLLVFTRGGSFIYIPSPVFLDKQFQSFLYKLFLHVVGSDYVSMLTLRFLTLVLTHLSHPWGRENQNMKGPVNACLRPGPKVIMLFSSSVQLSMKFQLLINVEIVKIGGKFRFKTKKKTSNLSCNVLHFNIHEQDKF